MADEQPVAVAAQLGADRRRHLCGEQRLAVDDQRQPGAQLLAQLVQSGQGVEADLQRADDLAGGLTLTA
ncbi:hypothetical protein D3C77_803660 [compost metagenome]